MKTRFLVLLLAFGLAAARAEDVSINLVAPSMRRIAGTEVGVDLLWLNSTAEAQRVHPPVTLDGVLRQGDRAWAVRLRTMSSSTDELTLGRGGFARRTYFVTLPSDLRGPAQLAIERPFAAAAMIDVAPREPSGSAAVDAPKSATAAAFRPVASRLRRTVLENFSFHEPIYFLYGPDEPVAKFQLSFRYRLVGHRDSPVETDPAAKGLYLGYTQRSLWNIKEPSSPFYDTSYMPELFFESLAPDRPDQQGLVSFIGYQAGYKHESNGRDGLDSRSLNIAYLRSGVLIGRRDGWRVVVAPRVFAYLGKSSDNENIADYRGYGELLVSVGREDGIQVNVTGMAGRKWNKGSVQVDATYPIKIPAVHFDTFLHVQYFDGYGECLRDYDRKSSTWRAGVSLVR